MSSVNKLWEPLEVEELLAKWCIPNGWLEVLQDSLRVMGILSYETRLSEGLAGLEWSLKVVLCNSSMLCLHFRILWAAADVLPPTLPWFPENHAAQQFLQCGSFLRGLPGPHIHGPGWLWCFPQSLLNSLGHYRCVGVYDLEAWADWQ